MTINCPECGRELQIDASLCGHMLDCPYCQARFAAPNPSCTVEPCDADCENIGDDHTNNDDYYYYYD